MGYMVGQGHPHYGPGTSLALLSRPVFPVPGMGCADCDGTCAACRRGLGLFEGGFDPTTWGIGEYFVVGIGAYVLYSVFFTTSRAVSRAREIPGERRKRKAARLRKEAAELTRR